MNIIGSTRDYLRRYKIIHNIYNMLRTPFRTKAIKKNGFYVLNLVNEIFQSLNLKHFADFGTLLGFIREKNFISHDLDLDFGVLINEEGEKKLIEYEMIKKGFIKTKEFIYEGKVVEESYKIQGVKVDFFYYKNEKNKSKCYSFYRLPTVHYKKLTDFSVFEYNFSEINEIEDIILNGTRVPVPKNSEKVLEERYGMNWKVPDKKFEFWMSPSIVNIDAIGILKKK
ncbi:hypothetical protein QWY14_07710 [Planococcus sp. N028]|uniref:LicD family protein n=1 Tax=Planococcus shixiaomingii TaxID=3058393 RepID=A0ABT8N1B6_9BACL|nr:hypothetical protein [Planococcus sp. N028]MDN7241675.1 hypothetical protein [Planococcus sp. N028]